MIIPVLVPVKAADIPGYSWSRLRRFHNIPYVCSIISDLHQLGKEHKQNVRKQSEQLRDCLIQAREYSEAAKVVSLVTKPVLQYYSPRGAREV